MLTKVGRTNPMLICTDCGFPIDQRETAILSRQRLWGAVTLVAMAMVGSGMLLLASIKEMRQAEFLDETSEDQKEDSSQASEKGEQGIFWQTSPLVDLTQPSVSRPGARSTPAEKSRAASTESGASSTQDRNKHQQPSQQQ
ncbi:MAG: hypothetical protein RLZZ609_932 [Cyanobacteriota bacterium]|jgi:cell division septation protein DedD